MVPVEKLKKMIGQENGVSDWILIDQKELTFLPMRQMIIMIHVDVEQAKKRAFAAQ